MNNDNNLKLCINCKYHSVETEDDDYKEFEVHWCASKIKRERNLVTGDYQTTGNYYRCDQQRYGYYDESCGKDGLYYQPKE